MKPEKKLFLLDAFALIYRAHFAFSKSPRITTRGMNTGATFGFTNSLLEIINKEKPTHIGVAFDTHAPTFRHISFPEYKAQREEQPEDIRVAIPYVKKIVSAFNIPVIELDGFEADDIIGTLAVKAAENGFEVFMMTPDKDYSQLVREHVYLYKPAYMGNAVDILGVKEVLAKWEIDNVDQVRDVLGLIGDKVDNIPGIPGIGPKNATKLLQEFGTVENIIANADKLKGKQRENIELFGQQGILSKDLATINVNVPILFNDEELRYKGPDEEKLTVLFSELEFRTMMKRVFGEGETSGKLKAATKSSAQLSMFDSPANIVASVGAETEGGVITEELIDEEETPLQVTEKENIHTTIHDYHLIDTHELRVSLAHYLSLQKEFCFDTESTGLDAIHAELVGLSFCYIPGEAYFVPIPQNREEATKIVHDFKEVFENESICKIGQNIKYDTLILKKYGIEVKGQFFDTMIAHYLIDPESRHNMTALSEHYLNYTPVPIEDLIGKKGKFQLNMKDVDIEIIKEYAAEDSDVTLQLKYKLEPELKKANLENLYHTLEAPLIQVLAAMENEGIKVDTNVLKELSVDLENESRIIEKEIYEIAGCEFNIASPKQLGEVLFEKLKVDKKPKKTKSGQYATGEEILIRLAGEHKIANKILEFREFQKLKSTYLDALPELLSPVDGRIHSSFNQAVAATGRLSSTNPNLQNIPIRTARGREIRKAFVPRGEGFTILSADYSQIELRIMASFAKDESMIEAFRNGRDIHATTAAKIFNVPLEEVSSDMRRKAKTANFGIIYGISAFGLSQRLDIPRKEAAEIIEAYFQEFPTVKQYMDDVIMQAREAGYVETIMGRRRYLRDINSQNATMRGMAERNAINAPIQGSAADIIKIAMVRIHNWLTQENLKTKMILQVHDELVFDVYQEELDLVKEKVADLMKGSSNLEVPMEIGIGTGSNWLDAH
jgi:DNA polymerase I